MHDRRSKTALTDVIATIYHDQNYQRDVCLSWCEYLLGGNLILRMGHAPRGLTYEDGLKFTPETIDWNISYEAVTNIAQLYLHSLEPVRILLLGHLETSKAAYLDLARAIIQSWLDFDLSGRSAANEYAWYDHCVSERTMIFILYSLLAEEAHGPEHVVTSTKVATSLQAHANYLYDDEKYVPQNHGTMMDRSLYIVSRFVESPDQAPAWREKALTRLSEALHRDFSDSGVNLENASSYHVFNLHLFMGLEYNVLRPFGDTLGENTGGLIEKAIDFLVYAAQPDKRLPFWGAGAKVDLKQITTRSTYPHIKDHPGLAYLMSDGKAGRPPARLVNAYEREGYVFLRNSWQVDRSNQMYVSFKAGFVMRNHKHADDLSFTLFACGEEILVDSGVFTYVPDDFHHYFVSAPAHNSIAVDGKSYDFRRGDLAKVGILTTHEAPDYVAVTAKNDLYDGVAITRTFVFLGAAEAVILIDDIESHIVHSYTQNFHLAHRFAGASVEPEASGPVHTTLISDGELSVAISQLIPAEPRVHRGDVRRAGPGLLSETFNSIQPTTSIEFGQVGDRVRFITAVYVPDQADARCSMRLAADALHVAYRGLDVTVPLPALASRLERSPHLVIDEIGPNDFHLQVRGTDPAQKLEYAWYFIDEAGERDVVWYSEDHRVRKVFDRPGLYQVEFFLKDSDGGKVRYRHPRPIVVSEVPGDRRAESGGLGA